MFSMDSYPIKKCNSIDQVNGIDICETIEVPMDGKRNANFVSL